MQSKARAQAPSREPARTGPDGQREPRRQPDLWTRLSLVPATRSHTAGGDGDPLPPAARHEFSDSLGRDLSDVRLHRGPAAQSAARSLGATAFTLGRDIVFGASAPDPTSAAGRPLLAHELAHVSQQTGATAGPPTLASPAHERDADRVASSLLRGEPARPALAGPPQIARQTDPTAPTPATVDPKEAKAAEAAQAKVGAPGVTLVLSFPLREPVERATVSIADVVIAERQVAAADPTAAATARRGYDSAAAALAHLTINRGTQPGVVLQQDNLFFPAFLVAEPRFVREQVWKVEPGSGVAAAIGSDGNSFPLGQELQRSPDHWTDRPTAAPVSAAALRAAIGVASDQDILTGKAGGPGDRVTLPKEAQERLIRTYFRARALESLEQNRSMVDKLADQFAPTGKGDANTASSGVSPAAKALIDSSRRLAPHLRELLENEATLDKYLTLVGWRRSFRGANWKITVDGKEDFIWAWEDDLKARLKKIRDAKSTLLSQMPMLAQLVENERAAPSTMSTFDRLAYRVGGDLVGAGERASMAGSDGVHNPTVYGENQVDASLFGKQTPDEVLRAAFAGKLDAVRKAIRWARESSLTEDDDFLFGLSGLRSQVVADLSGSAAVSAQLKDMLKAYTIKEVVKSIGETAIQIGLLFVPGGQVLSAALGFVIQGRDMAAHLKQWDFARASLDPGKALVDQQEASDQLLMDTVFMAVQAVDLAGSVVKSLRATAKIAETAEGAAKGAGKTTVREAEEQAGKVAQIVDAAPLKPVKVPPMPSAGLSDDFAAKLSSLGVEITEKAGKKTVTSASPQAILAGCNYNWTLVKHHLVKAVGPQDKAIADWLMQKMLAHRQQQTHGLLREIIAEYDNARGTAHSLEAVGSTSLTSDLDFSVRGPHAADIVADFNKRIRPKLGNVESATAFDTNLYTSPAFLEVPLGHDPTAVKKLALALDPKDPNFVSKGPALWDALKGQVRRDAGEGAAARIDALLREAEQLFPNDLLARVRHVTNFRQEAASHMAAADKLLGEGPQGLAKWTAYKDDLLQATPAARRDGVRRVLEEAEQRTLRYQDEVLSELNATGARTSRDQLSKMAGAAETDPVLYDRYMKARNAIYERKLAGLGDLRRDFDGVRGRVEQLNTLFQQGLLSPQETAELAELKARMSVMASGLHGAQSEALYFAAEAYQTHGSLLHVVQNAQKAKGATMNPSFGKLLAAQARDACYENLGKVLSHAGGDVDEALKAGKYLERGTSAYLAHPLKKDFRPPVLDLVARASALKSEGKTAEIGAMLQKHYGAASEAEALARYQSQLAHAAGEVRKRMAAVSGLPMTEIEQSWRAMDPSQIDALIAHAADAARAADIGHTAAKAGEPADR
jgi:hypothetical protein